MRVYFDKNSFVFSFIILIMVISSFTIVHFSPPQLGHAKTAISTKSSQTISQLTDSCSMLPDFLNYFNPTTGLQLKYPSDWKKVEDKSGVYFYSALENTTDRFQEYVYISSFDYPETNNLSERINQVYKDFKERYHIVSNPSTENVTTLGIPAMQAIFEYNDGKRDMKVRSVTILKDYKAYEIRFFAPRDKFDDYFPIVQKMIDSFRIGLSQYENTNLGISIQHPLDWELNEDIKNNITKFLGPDYETSSTYLSVYVYKPIVSPKLGDIISSEQSRQDYKLIGSSNTTMLGGYPAHTILYSFANGNDQMKAMMFFTIHDNKVYEIKFFTCIKKYDDYIPIVQKMIDSFRIVDFLPFDNNRVTFEYPSNWKKLTHGANVTFLSPLEGYWDSFQEYVNISSKDIPYNMAIDKYLNASDNKYKQFHIIKESNPNLVLVNTTLYGNTTIGYYKDYDYKDSNQEDFILREITAKVHNKLYEIKFFGPADKSDNYSPFVQKMIDTFRIVDFLPIASIDFDTYKNRQTGIELKYPSDWKKVEEQNGVYFNGPLEVDCSYYCLQPQLSIFVTPSKYNLQEIVSSEINTIRKYPGLKLIELNETALADNQAYKFVYSYYANGGPAKVMELITLIGDKAYYVSYVSDDKKYHDYLPIIYKMLNSVIIGSFKSVNPDVTGIKVANNPFAIAFDPITKKLYVSNSRSNTISVINTLRNNIISNITVGSFPYAIALDEIQNTIYVANEKSNTVSVIDGSTDKLVETISVDKGPVDIAVNSYADRIYTANYCSNSISVIEGSTNTVMKNITLGQIPDRCSNFAMGIAVNTFTNMIYVTNRDSDTIYVIDGNTDNIVDKIYVMMPFSVAVNPLTNTIYSVGSEVVEGVVEGVVNVIDGFSNNVVGEFSGFISPNIIITNPSTNMVYLTDSGNNTMWVINGSINRPFSNISVDEGPAGVTLDQDTNTLYVANQFSNTVSVINGNTDKIMVGVNFKVEPLDSGKIYCNDHEIANNDYNKYDVGTELKCEAKAKNIFPPLEFASWSVIPPKIFQAWTGDLTSDSVDNPTATFRTFQQGQLVANFKELVTDDYMNTIFGTLLALAIPAAGGLLYKNREWLFSKLGRRNN